MEKSIILRATTEWKLEAILNCLIRGNGWNGFHAGIGSEDGKVKVTVTVSRELTSKSKRSDNACPNYHESAKKQGWWRCGYCGKDLSGG